MFIEVLENSLNIVGEKPIESNSLTYKVQSNQALFETIKIENGIAYNLKYHQDRVDRSFKEYYNTSPNLNLEEVLSNLPKNGFYRAKVIYNKSGLLEYSYYIYKKKDISTLLLVENSNFKYSFKFISRDYFNKIQNQFKNFDELLLTNGGYLQDSTIANIALFHKDSKQWHTPKEPLLFGTTLNRYIELNRVMPKYIHYTELKEYSKIATLNAMVDFNIL